MSRIVVGDATHEMLAELKEEWGVDSYDELLRRLVMAARAVPDSLFGSVPKMRPFDRDERTRKV